MAIKRKTNGIPPIPRGPRNPGGPYADAKKKDPKLDSYIKTRNNSEKGTAAYNAAQNSYTLIMTIKNTFEKGTKDSEAFLEYANEFIGFFAIAKDLPKLANDIFTTSKLVFSGAKTKKVKDKGNLGKALDELNLEI